MLKTNVFDNEMKSAHNYKRTLGRYNALYTKRYRIVKWIIGYFLCFLK